MSNRDTQFAGFAKSLMQELLEPAGYIDIIRGDTEALADYERRIACRAYDLVAHALNNEKLQWYPMEEVSIEEIPDLIELPNLEVGIDMLYCGYEEVSRGLPPMPGPSGQIEQGDE